MNGSSDSQIVSLRYTTLNMKFLKKKIKQEFKINIQQLRLFTQQGVEIFEEDLNFIKDGLLLYVSDGLDFDSYSQISVYEIVKVLGEGGFGKVMLGKHKVTGEMYAIKVIDALKMWNAADIDLIFREAELMKNLSHPNIIKIFNCYTLSDMQVVLIMEYLQGGDLVDYLQEKGRLNEEEAKYIFKQAVDAIRYCHDHRLIHRDLKLENILLTSKTERKIKIIDFGIAGIAMDIQVDKLDLGSLNYMAPEVLTEKLKYINTSIDVWALGVILFALCSGYLPFNSPQQQTTLNNIIACNYQFPPFHLSKEFKDLITNMLNPDHTKRITIYQILNHPWMSKTTLLQAPKTHLKLRKDMSRRGNLLVSPTMIRGVQQLQLSLKSGVTSLKASFTNQTLSKQFNNNFTQTPAISINEFIGLSSRRSNEDLSNSFVAEQKKENEQPKRKYSQFNQKLLDRIYREDTIREKKERKKRIILSQSNQQQQQQQQQQQRNSTAPTIRMHSKQSSLDKFEKVINNHEKKKLSQKQLCLQTIIDLTHRPSLLSISQTPLSQPKRNQNQKFSHFSSLYQLQSNFRHRKGNSDQEFFKTFKREPANSKVSIKAFYSSIFSQDK